MELDARRMNTALHLRCCAVFMYRASRSIRCNREKPSSRYVFLLYVHSIFQCHSRGCHTMCNMEHVPYGRFTYTLFRVTQLYLWVPMEVQLLYLLLFVFLKLEIIQKIQLFHGSKVWHSTFHVMPYSCAGNLVPYVAAVKDPNPVTGFKPFSN